MSSRATNDIDMATGAMVLYLDKMEILPLCFWEGKENCNH